MPRIYLFADTHLQAVSANDPLLPDVWRADSSPVLPMDSEALLRSHLDRAVAGGADLILCGGDLFHFPSPENAALASRLFAACPLPVWCVPGNHDWFYPGQDGWEELRAAQLPRLEAVFGRQAHAWSRVHQGLRVIGLDNSTSCFDREQVDFLAAELARGEPSLVMLHIPISLPRLREDVIAKHGSPLLMADPETGLRPGVDAEATREGVRLLHTAPHVRLVLAAHVHLAHRDPLESGGEQLIPEAGYRHGHCWITV